MKSIILSSTMIAVWVVIAIVSAASAAPVENSAGALTFLSEFGYITGEGGAERLEGDDPPSDDDMKKAIKDYQAFMGLPVTGTLDEDTLKEMNTPRCGTKDILLESESDRFSLQGSLWAKSTLTYKISKYPSKLRRSDADLAVKESFNRWSQVTPLRFVRRNSGPVDIEIKFVKGAHGDNKPFDGRGYKLAHARFPQYGGDAHFDDDENWTMDFTGNNVYHTAIHEFGHSLGLRHSKVRGAIMYPNYQPIIELHQDDIKGIQRLYPFKKG